MDQIVENNNDKKWLEDKLVEYESQIDKNIKELKKFKDEIGKINDFITVDEFRQEIKNETSALNGFIYYRPGKNKTKKERTTVLRDVVQIINEILSRKKNADTNKGTN